MGQWQWQLQWYNEVRDWMRDRVLQPDPPRTSTELAELAAQTLGLICWNTARPAGYWYEIAREIWTEGDDDERLEPPVSYLHSQAIVRR